MSKILMTSAAVLLIASASANAQMLLFEDANDSKLVVNQWAGQIVDPIAREVENGTVREFASTHHPLAIDRARTHYWMASPSPYLGVNPGFGTDGHGGDGTGGLGDRAFE